MPIRNTHRIGSYLMLDDESGAVHYRESMLQIWDGSWRHRKNFETRQPQEFVKARTDPKALRDIRVEPAFASATSVIPLCVGESTLKTTRNSPGAGSIFEFGILGGDPGIGEMTIGASATSGPFKVR